jgi:predicted XRE-type DNA-binding protein
MKKEYSMTYGAIKARERRAKNPEKSREQSRNQYYKRKEKTPWLCHYYNAKGRCENKNHWYFKKGIKFLMTKDEMKKLWFRDKAYNLTNPSIDRILPEYNYTYKNCRFIEKSENIGNPRGEKANSKLKNQDINDIRELYKTSGLTQKQISRLFNVSQTQIGRIVRHECWSHIT